MKAELRADGLHITGYVNVPGRESRPIRSPRGKFIEVIEQRAFQRAIDRAPRIDLLLDHDRNRILASTADKTLSAEEDNVGLRAETVITDEHVIKEAKAGNLRGWSFNIKNPKDEFEERADGELPVRRIKDFNMDEISLVLNKVPAYQATSIELRADDEDEMTEYRASMEEVIVNEKAEPEKKPDLSEYRNRLNRL
ncbi:HK97 family phage prohead protease [Emergencia sp.]|uniref:HK97 family phage prohead protease n=1 Tax=Emergencia sp. TaxID=1926557 RepID=UPI003AEFB051